MNLDLKTIGNEIKTKRLSVGVTQATLAECANISRATIIGLENNTIKEIGVRRLSRLLDVLNKMRQIEVTPKSKSLNLIYPYDWSNPSISDNALIINVLEYGFFEDITAICVHYGFDRIAAAAGELESDSSLTRINLNRMLNNIRRAIDHAI